MSGSVFEQYQKYFDSLITRHKTTCQLENQNQNQLPPKPPSQPSQQPPQPSQQPPQQPPQPSQQQEPQEQKLQQQQPQQPQQQQQPPQQQQQHPQQQPTRDLNAQDIRRQLAQTNWQPSADRMYVPMAAPQHQMYQPLQTMMYRQAYNAPDVYCYFGRGAGVMPYQQYHPYAQQQRYLQQQQPHYDPEDYFYGRTGTRPLPTDTCPSVTKPPVPEAAATFIPDGCAEAAVEANKQQQEPQQQQTLCYPYGVSGYQGGIPCGPCTSCKAATAAPATSAQQQQQQQQQQQKQKQQPCDTKDCSSGWAAANAGGESTSKGKEQRDRLPLGVDEPFILGPTTYQYFFDHPA